MPKLIKKILLVYISIVLTFAPSSVFAASAGGWAFNSFNIATSVVTAIKVGASASVAVAKSPVSQKIAKGIVGGAIAGAAIPLAISQLSGIALEAVDWVLDPANNAIKYKLPSSGAYNCQSYRGNTAQEACTAYVEATDTRPFKFIVCHVTSTAEGDCYFEFQDAFWGTKTTGFRYKLEQSSSEPQYKSIPIPTVADKIYDNAKTDAASASVVNDAVKEYVNEGSADTALDNAKTDTDASHACGTGTHWSGSACVADTPTTPTTPTTPDTPFDPSSILAAIASLFDAVMSLPDVINNALDDLLNNIKDFFQPLIDALQSLITKLTDFFDAIIAKFDDFLDWVKSDPDPQTDNTKPDIDTKTPTKSAQDFDSNYINFGGQCPSFSPTTISVGMVAVPISFNAQPLCDFAILCRPIILALAYFAAMAIVANAIRSE